MKVSSRIRGPSRARTFVAALLAVAFAAMRFAARAATGPDPAFQAELEAAATIVDVAPYTNGTFLVAGDFHRIGGVRHNQVALLDADGVPVPGFHAAIAGDASVASVAVQPDGRILVSGAFPRVAGSDQGGMIRLLPDGQLDPSFRFDGALQDGYRLGRVVLDGAGHIYLASYAGGGLEVLRMDANGRVDPDRTIRIECVIRFVGLARPPGFHVLADGRLYLTGGFEYALPSAVGFEQSYAVLKLRPDGSPDPSFDIFENFMAAWPGDPGRVRASALLPDGRLLVGGQFKRYNRHDRPGILAINPDGSLDLEFHPRGIDEATVDALVPLPDGSVVAGGTFRVTGEAVPRSLVRFLPDGALDTGYHDLERGLDVETSVLSVVPVGGDRVVVAGRAVGPGDTCPGAVSPRGPDGHPVAVAPPAVTPGVATHLLPAPEGTVYIAGEFQRVNGLARPRLARLLRDGTVDPAFNPTAGRGHYGPMALLPDGSLLLQGMAGSGLPLVDKLDRHGNRDPGFSAAGVTGSLAGMLPRADGDILLWGHLGGSSTWATNPVSPLEGPLVLLGPDGTRRTNAIPPIWNLTWVGAVVALPDGGFIVDGGPNGSLRLDEHYAMDPTWWVHAADGHAVSMSNGVQSLARDSHGRILAIAGLGMFATNSLQNLVRLLPDGTIDGSFVPRVAGGTPWKVSVDASDRVLVQGSLVLADGTSRREASLVRLLPDGTVDPEFAPIGSWAYATAVRDDDLYVSYVARDGTTEPSGTILRYHSDPLPGPMRWTWSPSTRALVLDAGAGAAGMRWETSRDLKTWTAVPGNAGGATLSADVPADDAPRFFRAAR